MARIDAGPQLRRSPVDLGDLVATETERSVLLAPSLAVRRTGLPNLVVAADPTRVAQVLSNLLDNARRHTPVGGEVTVDLAREGEVAALTVIDTGPGIAEADHERIFGRLVRLDDARDRDSGGAGLGLAIARGLARAHGGDLVCLPRDGGARFRLTLPAGPLAAAPGWVRSSSAASVTSSSASAAGAESAW